MKSKQARESLSYCIVCPCRPRFLALTPFLYHRLWRCLRLIQHELCVERVGDLNKSQCFFHYDVYSTTTNYFLCNKQPNPNPMELNRNSSPARFDSSRDSAHTLFVVVFYFPLRTTFLGHTHTHKLHRSILLLIIVVIIDCPSRPFFRPRKC